MPNAVAVASPAITVPVKQILVMVIELLSHLLFTRFAIEASINHRDCRDHRAGPENGVPDTSAMSALYRMAHLTARAAIVDERECGLIAWLKDRRLSAIHIDDLNTISTTDALSFVTGVPLIHAAQGENSSAPVPDMSDTLRVNQAGIEQKLHSATFRP